MASIGDTTRPAFAYDQATDTWVPVGVGPHSHTPAAIGAISSSLVTAKGDLIVATGSGVVVAQPVGTNGQVLTADSTQADGVVWAAPVSGSMTQLATGTLSGSSVIISGLSGSYRNLKVIITGYTAAAGGSNLQLRINNDSTANRHVGAAFGYFPTSVAFNSTFINGITDGVSTSVTTGIVEIDIPNYANTTTMKMVTWFSVIPNAATPGNVKLSGAIGAYNQTSAVTGLTFLADGSTFTGGTYTVFGVN